MPTDPPSEIEPTATPEKPAVDARGGATQPTGVSVTDQTPSLDRPVPPRAFLPTIPGFRIVREVGRGGMGLVFEAVQEGLDRTVALKMLRLATTAAVARFRAEALAVARLRHPDIVQVYAVGEHAGEPYLVLEYCPGGTLAARIAQAPLTPDETAILIARIARAVHTAHEAGIVHRDLKPANILLTEPERDQETSECSHAASRAASQPTGSLPSPKVTDFGLAKLLGEQGGMTATGDVLGTPCYMAPEQSSLEYGPVGPATDIYALGAILYELLTGRVPFLGTGALETMALVRTTSPTRPRELKPHLPADLEAIAMQCLEKNPRERYATAADVAADLERWLAGEPIRARRKSFLYRLGKRLRRRRRISAVAASILFTASLAWLISADAGISVPAGASVRDWLDDRDFSMLRPVPSDSQIRAKAHEQRERFCRNLLARRFGRGWFGDPGTTMSDAWTQSQVTVALCMAPEISASDRAELIPAAHELFEPNPVYPPYVAGEGWLHFNDRNPSAETLAWGLCGVARLLGNAPLSPSDRAKFETRLTMIQSDLDQLRARGSTGESFTGGWLHFTNQHDLTISNLYVTVIVLHGLLDLHDAGLGWRGRIAERDELLVTTANWLVARFDGTGWRTRGSTKEGYNDGLTLLILAQLLRAEATGMIRLPESMLARIPELLDDCGRRSADHPGSIGVFDVMLVGPAGQPISSPLRTVRFPWFAWAVRVAASWIDRLERTGGSRRDLARTRRVLGHLILGLGDTIVQTLEDDLTFLLAETLIGLSAIKE